jgi:hypothetical protein
MKRPFTFKSRHRRTFLSVAIAALGVILTSASAIALAQSKTNANTAGPPTTTHSVQPTYNAGNITRCPQGTTTFINTSDSVPGNQSVSYSKEGTTFDAKVDSTGTYIDFTTNSPSFTVYVKGGPAYDSYDYTGTAMHPAFSSDTRLHSPYNGGGQIAVISHYLVCGQPASSSPPPGSCQPSSSLSVLVSGSNVTSYVPKGSWSSGATGISVVNVEGSSITNTMIPSGSDVINSAASNPITGQTVASANNNHVYILKGTGLDPSVSPNPLTDAGTGSIGFSGGAATTTGVAMDAIHNKAVFGLSIAGSPGFQFLNLGSSTFEPAFTSPSGEISEDPLIDPTRNLLLSATESNNYEIANVTSTTSPTFFENGPIASGGVLDSSGEDCSTGIALAPAEGAVPSHVFVADLTQATFTPGSPGTWTAPSQVQNLSESSLSAGASGVAVAQGTHTAVVSGEFGGNSLTALKLPTTSGTGTPAISDWVTCSISGFNMGFDPHTLTAYQSPNGGDAIGLLTNGGATELERVDLTKMLEPTTVPRTVGGHGCASGTLPAAAVSSISVP